MKQRAGFSLVELLVTLSLMAILLTLAVPSFQHLGEKNAEGILQKQLLKAIEIARSEAISRGIAIGLCKSQTFSHCDGNWQDGQIIFTFENASLNPLEILTTFQGIKVQGNLFWRAFPSYRDYLLFSPTGFLQSDNGTFWYCKKGSDKPAWAITLNKAGRARIINTDKEQIASLTCLTIKG